jgi:hypothetical protein
LDSIKPIASAIDAFTVAQKNRRSAARGWTSVFKIALTIDRNKSGAAAALIS